MHEANQQTDSELIAAASGGDAEAWRLLYGRWLPWVWRYAYSLVQDTHTAEDVTSEAMTAWIKRLRESGGEPAQVAAWLRTVVRNKAADHHRGCYRRRRMLESVTASAQHEELGEDPSKPLDLEETQDQVAAALDKLSETQRLVLEWKYAESLRVRVIADRLNTTEKSVEALLYRARKEFRTHYEFLQLQQDHSGFIIEPNESGGDSPLNNAQTQESSETNPDRREVRAKR